MGTAVTEFIAVCKAAIAVASKVKEVLAETRFTAEERELLVAAADKGEYHIFDADQRPAPWVVAEGGRKQFEDENDPAVAARFRDAFRSLCERGYIEYVSGVMFVLTGKGFERAREFASATAK